MSPTSLIRPVAAIGLPCLALGVLLCVSGAAHAEDLPGGTQPGTIERPIADARDCLECHAGYEPTPTVAPGDTWSGSMMANSARDPIFFAALAVANQDVPGAGHLCLRCHSPAGWLAGRSAIPDASALTESDREQGVGCGFCHRLVAGEDEPVPGPLVGNAR